MNRSRPLDAVDIERHARFVRAIARRLCRDEQTADDVVQDTWVAAAASPPRATGGEEREGWFGRVARRLAQRSRRSAARVRAREERAARDERVESPLEALSRESALRGVTEAVLALDEPYRGTILSSFYEGLDAAAIARRDSVPVATVRSRRARALAQLRERLDRQCGGERGVWSQALLALADSSPLPAPAAPATPAGEALAPTLVTGALTLSTAAKLAAATAVLALGAALWMRGSSAPDFAPDSSAVAQVPGPQPVLPEPERADSVPALAPETRSAEPLVAAQPAAPPGLATVEVRALTPSGAPAAGRVIELVPARPHGPGGVRHERTDARGLARFEEIQPGAVRAYADLGGQVAGEAEGGALVELELALAEGLRVRGRVVDAAGNGVADAEVLVFGSQVDMGIAAARTDGTGAFALGPVEPWREIGARHPRLGPSARHGLRALRTGADAEEVEVTLELVGRAAALSGVVRDADGSPVPGAWLVTSGYARGQVWDWRDHVSLGGRSDAAGAFRLEGLPVGSLELSVAAAGLAPLVQTVEVAQGENALEVVLEGEGRVVGTVRGPEGGALAGVEVALAGYGSARPRTRSDAAGRFDLGGLPTGAVDVVAQHARGRITETLQLAAGAAFEWEPVLGEGRVLRGRVVDGNGHGLAGWSLHARMRNAAGSMAVASAGTDEDGAFLMTGVEAGPFHVEVYSTEETYQRVRRVADVVPDDGPIEVVIGDEHLPSARVSGRIEWSDGTPVFGSVILRGSWGGRYYDLDGATGGFDLGPFAPGPYEFVLEHGTCGEIDLGNFELAPRESRDLGRIVFDAPGTLFVRVDGERGAYAPFERLMVHQRGTDERSVPWRSIHDWGEGLAGDGVALLPGSYVLFAKGTGLADELVPFEVTAGEEVSLELAPRPGVPVLFRFVPPEGAEPVTHYTPALEVDGEPLLVMQPRTVLTRSVPLGSARLVVRSDTGLVGEVVHTFAAGDAPPAGERFVEVEVLLR